MEPGELVPLPRPPRFSKGYALNVEFRIANQILDPVGKGISIRLGVTAVEKRLSALPAFTYWMP